MSVKERMREIREAERKTEEIKVRRVEETLARIERAKEKKYQEGLPEALKLQAELLEKLREVGIISLLEKMTGPIVLIPADIKTANDQQKELRKRQNDFNNTLLWSNNSGEWVPFILQPERGENGRPEDVLKIEIKKHGGRYLFTKDFGNIGSEFTFYTVSLEYDSLNKRLNISGKKDVATFRENLERSRLPQYEVAIACAFLEPQATSIRL